MFTGCNILLLLLISLEAKSQLIRATYNETCEEIRCDSKKSLLCVDGLCQCIKPTEMIFDSEQDKCVVLSGERCSYTAVEILTETTQEKKWTEKLDCVEHAICSSDGYCNCENYYFENKGGTCLPMKIQGGNCKTDTQCRTDLYLTCQNGICSCNETEAIFDFARNSCVGIVGASCSKYRNTCVRNARCSEEYESYDMNRYGYREHMKKTRYLETCECQSDKKASKKGLCLSNYGQSCNYKLSPCNEEFACFDRTCQCHFPTQQKYENGKCISYVRGPCKEFVGDNFQEFECVDKAICANSSGIFECQCKERYIESTSRQCRLKYGQHCEVDNECDSAVNLKCKYGKCSCGDLETYDHERNKCQGLVGAQCNIAIANKNYCVDGAFCKSYRDSAIQKGTCSCSMSFVTTLSRNCVLVHPTLLSTVLQEVNQSTNLIDDEDGRHESAVVDDEDGRPESTVVNDEDERYLSAMVEDEDERNERAVDVERDIVQYASLSEEDY